VAEAAALRGLRAALRPGLRLLAVLERLSIAIASVCFMAIVLVTATDVVRRYAFNAPLSWSFTLISDYLMVAVFFLAIGSTQRHGQNVGVDLLVRRLPDRPRAALAALVLLLVLVFVALVGAAGWDVFIDAWESGNVQAGVIPWPRWPSVLLVPLGCLLLGLRLVADLLVNVAAACGAVDLAPHRRPRVAHGFAE